ncbi:transposase domain-containing protein [Streptomyces sp. NPDC055189]
MIGWWPRAAGPSIAEGCFPPGWWPGPALCSPAPYLEVLRHLVAGLRGVGGWGSWRMPAKSSPLRARDRLGSGPLRVLFAATARPLAGERTPGAFLSRVKTLVRTDDQAVCLPAVRCLLVLVDEAAE